MCLSALNGIDFLQWRRRAGVDTAAIRSPGDTLAHAAIAAGRACAARFSGRSVALAELKNLRALALAIGDVPLASAAATRLAAEAPDTANTVNVLAESALEIASARYGSLAAADTVRQRLTAYRRMGTLRGFAVDLRLDSMRARASSLDTNILWRNVSHARTGLLAFRPTRAEFIAVFTEFNGRQDVDYTNSLLLVDALRRGLPHAVMHEDADTLAAHAAEWAREVWNFDPVPEQEPLIGPAVLRTYWKRTLQVADHAVSYAPPDYWLTPHDTTLVSSAGPLVGVPGKVTILLPIAKTWGADARMIAQYLRLIRKYADTGLTVIAVHVLEGAAFASAPLEPAAEAKVAGWYLHTYLRLPWPVAVYGASTSAEGRPQVPTFIGRDGTLLPTWVSQYTNDEVALDAFLRQALGLPQE